MIFRSLLTAVKAVSYTATPTHAKLEACISHWLCSWWTYQALSLPTIEQIIRVRLVLFNSGKVVLAPPHWSQKLHQLPLHRHSRWALKQYPTHNLAVNEHRRLLISEISLEESILFHPFAGQSKLPYRGKSLGQQVLMDKSDTTFSGNSGKLSALENKVTYLLV